MKVHWTNTAIDHLLSIYEYISKDSSTYVLRTVDKLTRRSEQITNFPLSGRMVPEYEAEDIREVIEKPFRIIYRIKSNHVDILAVVHSSRLLSSDLNIKEINNTYNQEQKRP